MSWGGPKCSLIFNHETMPQKSSQRMIQSHVRISSRCSFLRTCLFYIVQWRCSKVWRRITPLGLPLIPFLPAPPILALLEDFFSWNSWCQQRTIEPCFLFPERTLKNSNQPKKSPTLKEKNSDPLGFPNLTLPGVLATPFAPLIPAYPTSICSAELLEIWHGFTVCTNNLEKPSVILLNYQLFISESTT